MTDVRGPVSRFVGARTIGLMQVRIGKSAANISLNTAVLDSNNSIGAVASTKWTATKEYYEYKSGTPPKTDGYETLTLAAGIECAFLEHTPFNYALADGQDPLADVNAAAVKGTVFSTLGTVSEDAITVTNAGGVVADEWIVIFTGANTGMIVGKYTGHVHDFTALDSAMTPDDGVNPYFSIPANFFTGTWANGDTYTFYTTPYAAGTSAFASADDGALALGYGGQPAYIRIEAVQEFSDGRKMSIILPRAQSSAGIDSTQAEQEGNVPLVFSAGNADSASDGGHAAWDLDLASGIGPLGRVIWTPGS